MKSQNSEVLQLAARRRSLRSQESFSWPLVLVLTLTGLGCHDLEGRSASSPHGGSAEASDASGVFMVARPEMAREASLTCAGAGACPLAVERVNKGRGICADGHSDVACRVDRIDFAETGLEPAEAERFARASFATREGLVFARLERAGAEAVLVVTEAWQGQTRAAPKGLLYRLEPTGKLCLTPPCESFRGERLNTDVVKLYNAVNLIATGAAPGVIDAADRALTQDGLIVAGIYVPLDGPMDRAKDLRASEFYLPLRPHGTPLGCQEQSDDFEGRLAVAQPTDCR